MKAKEVRVCGAPQFRAAEVNGERTLVGYAAVFNALSVDLGGFREKIRRGAFADSVATGDVRALWSHDSSIVLGRNRSGTLELSEDEIGLRFTLHLPDTSAGRDAFVSVERGDVSGVSFGFTTLADGFEDREGEIIRTLEKVELHEISPVAFPAYPQTDVAVRSLEQWRQAVAAAARAPLSVRLRQIEAD